MQNTIHTKWVQKIARILNRQFILSLHCGLLFSLLLLYLPLFGQTNDSTVDSLRRVIQQSDDLETKHETLLDLSDILQFTDRQEALVLSRQALAIAQAKTDHRMIAEAYIMIKHNYLYFNEFGKSIELIDSAIFHYGLIDDKKGIAKAKEAKSNVLFYQGNLIQAYQAIEEAIIELNKLGFEQESRKAKITKASLLDQIKEHDQAAVLYEEYFQDYNTILDDDHVYVLTRYGSHLGDQGKYDQAIAIFKEILNLGVDKVDQYTELIGILNLGWSYAQNNELRLAKKFADQGLALMSTIDNEYGVEFATKSLGYIALKQGLDKQAEMYLLQADTLAKSIGILQEQIDVSKSLHELFSNRKDHKRAYTYFQQHKMLSDSLFSIDKSRQLALLQVQQDVVDRERRNKELKTSLALQKQRSNYTKIAAIFFIVVCFLISLIALQRISNSRKLKQTVKERTHELQLANQELKEFAYITSHDMREPIRSIHSFSKLSERRLEEGNTAAVTDYLGIIKQSSLQLSSLVSDVYSFIRIDESVLEKTTFNLHDVLNDVVTDLGLQLKEKNAQIDFGTDLKLSTNYSLLKIIFKNLIENGIKYNESAQVNIQVSSSVDENNYYFTIADNGIGIDEEYQEYIFQMFKRLHSRVDYPGTGLGLPICKKIIRQLDGDIQLDVKPVAPMRTAFSFNIKRQLS